MRLLSRGTAYDEALEAAGHKLIRGEDGEVVRLLNMKLNTVDPFDYSRLYGDEKYSLQNMLLKCVNMPSEVPDVLLKDESVSVIDIWSDRIENEVWTRARAKIIKSNQTGDAFFNGVRDSQFIAFSQVLFNEYGGKGDVTGAMVIRNTNVSSGYPCLHFLILSAPKNTKLDTYGPPINRTKYDCIYDTMLGMELRSVRRQSQQFK